MRSWRWWQGCAWRGCSWRRIIRMQHSRPWARPTGGAFAGRFAEVRGDAYFAKGDKTAALREYRAARAAIGPASAANDLLDLKINDLSGAATSTPVSAIPKGN